ncbi:MULTISPECIES: HD-GYP domain-containing protein [Cytobacillus]|uniref:HD-GYP domain-containing protein n=1 Tax=Cytobacillus pseudoceanisediminis TaxID=3051614 RepID=A0ABZ2ZCP3_9BACI|nr:HD-GYP domain-containing protein [Cytobacillus oceanisediminis]MCS0824257.1 HD-GYP domain-containing protein [Cytobacillus firmus]MBU8729409.1 HD-GYP domain-containing protein [Cytobacillus oceanisediminis]MCM3245385.1 HD-GYP domain-containing protein [Cytobacillus oceanisediminis]MCM3403868.1 HD-GYP domain-containing protein [Cytobacillus oceanisediminis]MDK7667708.1 HD-GYP domain-containing protein [Cytobacillus oceanisediminis]
MGIINEDSFIETVHMKGLQISLIASGDGTEVIYHKLEPDARWGLEPLEGGETLEYLHLLSGKLLLKDSNGEKTFRAGDSFQRCPVTEHHIFQSIGQSEFLYVTSNPVFHYYSRVTNELRDLVISIEEKDGYTSDHCDRITKMSMLMADALDLNSRQILKLNLAAFLHDIGKVKVPVEILQKPGKLTSDEWELMKQHSTFGREILQETGLPSLIEAGEVVEQHHERYDGTGYPKGLKGDEIAIEAAIISVVDSFDAMTTDRVYQKGRSVLEAIDELRKNRGTMYNPDIVDTFFKIKDKLVKM